MKKLKKQNQIKLKDTENAIIFAMGIVDQSKNMDELRLSHGTCIDSTEKHLIAMHLESCIDTLSVLEEARAIVRKYFKDRQMKNYLLKDKIDNEINIREYLSRYVFLSNTKRADYCLEVEDTLYIYKFQTDTNVWYIHYDPTVDKVFRICVYESK